MRQTLVLLTLVLPFVIALVAPAAGLTAPRIADNLAAITEVRPLDVQVTVPGDHSAGETYEFAHALGPDPESLHPVAVYSEDYGVLWGMGEHATAFDEGSQAYVAMFGDGRDGDLTVPSGQTVTINSTRTSITASGATATVGSSSGFGVGDRVFVHQSQGTANVGRYELATIAAIDGASWTFEAPLAHTYSSASGKAQAVRIPQYQNVTVQGTLTAPAWDSSTGGILVVLANGLMEVSGTVSMDAKGFRGGREQVANSHLGGQGGEGIHGWSGHGGGGDPPYQATTPGGGGKTMDGDGAGASSGPGTGGAGGGYTYGNQTDEGAGGGGGGGHTYGGGGGGGGTDSNKAGGSGGLANAPTGGGGGGGGCGGGCDSPNSYGGSSGQPGGAGSFGGGAGGGLGNTGGGGNGQSDGRDSGAGGGGGGSSYGTPGLSALHLGSGAGGGGGHEGLNQAGGAGGAGGGAIALLASRLTTTGLVSAAGQVGQSTGSAGAGGGGAAGSILAQAREATLGTLRLRAAGGSGGNASGAGGDGGRGSPGRIAVHYCESLSGTTDPAASTQGVPCHIIEQVEAAPYNNAWFSLPEPCPDGQTYAVQFGRLLSFGLSGVQTTTLRVPAGEFSAATLDALLMNHEAGALFRLDIGADGTWDWSTSPAEGGDIRLSSPDLAEAFNAYWSGQGQPRQGNLDVPVVVWGNAGMEALLTNLVMLQLPNASPTPTHTPTQTATPTPEHWLALPMAVRMPTPTPSYWCDPYEPNGDRWTNTWGPLQPGQTYEAKLCQGDLEDNYHFRLPQAGTVSLRLELPGSLVGHTGVWVYAREHLATGAELFGLGPIQSSPAELTRWLGPGEYLVRIYTDGASDDAHPYRLRVGW